MACLLCLAHHNRYEQKFLKSKDCIFYNLAPSFVTIILKQILHTLVTYITKITMQILHPIEKINFQSFFSSCHIPHSDSTSQHLALTSILSLD